MELHATSLSEGPEKTFDDRYGYSSPRYMRENHYAVLVIFENFSGFQLQDKHNASSNSKMSWREFSLSKCKNMKNAGSAIIFPAFFMLAHKYL
ncbi:hypothetical protein [uncultured Phocaeicola sp.]|uniref:hypothetical protein n=1 Tax=uncultured Phocaeicola sp. TaxID=990718 RepID=UPI0025AEB3AB|nr:hypothetical protein [uncultured Phocaeicola sp.]